MLEKPKPCKPVIWFLLFVYVNCRLFDNVCSVSLFVCLSVVHATHHKQQRTSSHSWKQQITTTNTQTNKQSHKTTRPTTYKQHLEKTTHNKQQPIYKQRLELATHTTNNNQTSICDINITTTYNKQQLPQTTPNKQINKRINNKPTTTNYNKYSTKINMPINKLIVTTLII